MNIRKLLFLATLLCGITAKSVAADLMDVYQQALANDPKFKAAKTEWMAAKEALVVSRSALLPQIMAQGSITRNRTSGDLTPERYYNNSASYTLKLTQSIFNFGNWAQVWGSKAQAEGAHARFLAAEEELLQRTAEAYFNVLQAKDILSYATSKKREANRLFTQAKRKYEVGLIAIVDLEDAKKNYYQAVSDELTANNDLSDQFEKLNEITGVRYTELAPLKSNFPLLSPDPSNIEKWVDAAKKQNFEYVASRYDTIVARENVKLQNAGHLPTVDGTVSYTHSRDNNYSDSGIAVNQKAGAIGLQANLPIFQGGGVMASAKRADYQYQGKVAVEEQTHRAVISQTRQAYLGVLSNISKVKADVQAVKSSRASLRATEANYSVGTRTMADVLNAQAKLYEAQQAFAKDEYGYINQLLVLKALTGILTEEDLIKINTWLVRKSVTNNKVNQKKNTTQKNTRKIVPNSKTAKRQTNSKPNGSFAKGDLNNSKVIVFDVDTIQRAK